VELENLSERALPVLFSGAQALLLPSLYEGFGLPAIEAMACGCPVILSNTSALPETAGDAALYAAPNVPAEWEEAAKRIVSDTQLRQSMIQRGFERARLFSWDQCAAQTLAVYEKSL
jgi:glycosyltransferase involved in cell wall biosynthesis